MADPGSGSLDQTLFTKRKAAKLRSLAANAEFDGGDDRIRTCEGLLTLNDLANRRFQPLSHVSVRHLGRV